MQMVVSETTISGGFMEAQLLQTQLPMCAVWKKSYFYYGRSLVIVGT